MTASPLRVMIDARMLIGRFSGIARVVTRLVDELARRNDVEVVALCGRERFAEWRGRDDIEVVTTTFDRRDRTAVRRHLWEETHLRGLVRRCEVDLYHATWNTGVPPRCCVATVLTVHDLIPWRNPAVHFATITERLFHRRAVRAAIRRANIITTVSDYVHGQVLDSFALERGKVVTVPNGVDPVRSAFGQLAQAEARDSQHPTEHMNGSFSSTRESTSEEASDMVSRRYILYVGGHEPRKNVAAVFEAMGVYWDPADRSDRGVELRLTGDRASLCPAAARALERLRGDAPIRFIGHPDDAELSRHYCGAWALLMLSMDEGFGLPVLEAMAHGCPVIAARNASLPEVVGDAGILVDADHPEDVVNAIEQLMTDAVLRADLVARGLSRARDYTWRASAEAMVGAYRAALSEHRNGAMTATPAACLPVL